VAPKIEAPETVCDAAVEGGCRPLRADAVRNRARVLEAAEAVFAAQGLSVPVDVIAERAGVGVGTLYRHFPTKEKLFEAIVVGRMIDLAAEARARLDCDDPGAAFFGFLQHLVQQASLKRDLINALSGAGVELEQVMADVKQDMEDAVGALLARAQEAGAVRQDVAPAVVMSLVGATCMAADKPHLTAAPEELVGIICDGLRAPNAIVKTPRS
jgi:AcrR family transcriptional regulator